MPTVNPALAAQRRTWHRWHMDLYDALLFFRVIPRILAELPTASPANRRPKSRPAGPHKRAHVAQQSPPSGALSGPHATP